ncbi:MAG: hypothetical protein WC372_10365 [Candidatus Neomarinimicrobiota bacterium]|jgi:hypothetical protein
MGSDLYMNPPGQLERDRVVRAAVELVQEAEKPRRRDGREQVLVPTTEWLELQRLVNEYLNVR